MRCNRKQIKSFIITSQKCKTENGISLSSHLASKAKEGKCHATGNQISKIQIKKCKQQKQKVKMKLIIEQIAKLSTILNFFVKCLIVGLQFNCNFKFKLFCNLMIIPSFYHLSFRCRFWRSLNWQFR